ncbi:MAG: SDR family NAD(P)-dependent oxidoreductase, partial [Bacteroidetes bacterium]|nr:SDR family NAD(P)-dependent oxidoreductase [Bacteroidota bacterium]
MAEFKDTYGPWAIVTGASSGIGVEFARQLAAKGLNLILIARRKDRLDALAEELSGKHQITVKTLEVDLGASDFLEKVREGRTGLEVGLLVNNAGVAVNGPLHKPD